MLKKHWLLILIIILAAALRLWHLTSISLWHDEAFSALLINYSWREMLYRIALDVHPPAYYVALRLWHYGFGDSLWSLRGFSALFGVLSVPAAYLFVTLPGQEAGASWELRRSAFGGCRHSDPESHSSPGRSQGLSGVGVKQAFQNHKAAIAAAALIAANPFQILFVTEARMYTFGAFFALLAAYFLSQALRKQHECYKLESLHEPNLPQSLKLKRKFIWHYVGFALATLVMMYTHYYLLFSAAGLLAYGLIYHLYHYRDNLRSYAGLMLSYLLIGLLYLPWLPTFFAQFRQVSAAYWIPRMDKWSIPNTIFQMLFGADADINKTGTQLLVSLGLVFSLYFLYRFVKKSQAPEKWLVLLAILAPFGGALLFLLLSKLRGSATSVFLVRYFLFAAVFYSIALGVFLSQLKWQKFARLLWGIYLVANVWALAHYWKTLDIANKPGMSAAAKFINANASPKDLLVSGSSFEFFNLKYYLAQYPPFSYPPNLGGEAGLPRGRQGGVRPLLYSGGNTQVKNLPHFAGTALLTNKDLLPNFNAEVAPGQIVWLVWTNGFGGSKPEVPQNWQILDQRSFAEIRPNPGTNIYVDEYRVN